MTRTSTTRDKRPNAVAAHSTKPRVPSHATSASAKPVAADRATILSATQRKILQSFRTFLMRPGQMLCFSTHDLREWRAELAQLTRTGLLVAERFPGGYSLTAAGFSAMRAGG